MDSFYTNQLGSDPYILDTTVTYRYKTSSSSDLSTYTTGTISQKVFALDAVEAETNASMFSWNKSDKMNGNGFAFWVAAGYDFADDPNGWRINYLGHFEYSLVSSSATGARPAFWISLAD